MINGSELFAGHRPTFSRILTQTINLPVFTYLINLQLFYVKAELEKG
jgi:hypothetical protein